jgi:SAM-dependent methyltransferase
LSASAAAAGYADVSQHASVQANRTWWDAEADAYQAEHGDFLGGDTGSTDFVWCPEGLREQDARLLGSPESLAGRTVLEVGCGAAQCARWLTEQGARVLALDLSAGQLRHARELDRRSGIRIGGLIQADATRLPLRDATVDTACSAFGAVPFVADSAALHREVARVLRPGGAWVFSVTHPMRWCFADDPGPGGLTVERSYFDRRSYVETGDDGQPVYVEQHRTMGDRVREIVAAGLTLTDVVEPEWPAGHQREWGQWSPLRGRLFPGTAIYVCRKAD